MENVSLSPVELRNIRKLFVPVGGRVLYLVMKIAFLLVIVYTDISAKQHPVKSEYSLL